MGRRHGGADSGVAQRRRIGPSAALFHIGKLIAQCGDLACGQIGGQGFHEGVQHARARAMRRHEAGLGPGRREQHPVYYDMLAAFERRTGVPVLVNTSFNTRGEPVVCTPRDAIECFWTSPIDALSIGSFLLEKQE